MPQHNPFPTPNHESSGPPEAYPAHAGHHPIPISDNLSAEADQRQSAASSGGVGQPISDPLCNSVARKGRGRGGRRPGAGAPKGNLNALKHGRRSRQFAELGRIIAEVPDARDTLLAIDRRNNAKHRRAEEAAAERMIAFYKHCKDIAEGKPSPGPLQALAHQKNTFLTNKFELSAGAVEGLNARLNAPPKALSAAQSKKERDLLNAALEQIDREMEKIQKMQTNNQPVPQQSDPKYEITPD